MKEVNIYILGDSLHQRCQRSIAKSQPDYPCDEDMYNAILGTYPFEIVEDVCPSFDDMIEWDVRSISSEFVLWMCDEHAQTGSTSLVGILSSSAFERMISRFLSGSLSKHVKLLVRLTSLLYSSGILASHTDYDATTLWSLRSFVGTRVLQDLVLALCNTTLAAAFLEKLTALFLVLFATIIAVGYSEPRRPSGGLGASTCGSPVHQSPTSTESCIPGLSAESFSEAKTHLLCILAHHMVYIAERINLLEPNVSRKHIIEGSACRWNRKATFQWSEMTAPNDAKILGNESPSCDAQNSSGRADGTLPARYPARYYHLSRSHSPTCRCRLAGGFGTCVHELSLNNEPSPMDHLLAEYQQMTSAPGDVQAPIERTSTPQLDLDTITLPPHPTHRCSSDHLPSITARDGNYAAFECLAETDGMCAPFLCTDNDDNDNDDNDSNNDNNESNEASTTIGPSAPPTSPSTPSQASTQSSPTANSSPQTPAGTTPPNNTISTKQQDPVCRSCNFPPLPFATLDENDLCQFCAALPHCAGDDISALPSSGEQPDQEVLTTHSQREALMRDGHGCGNLLV